MIDPPNRPRASESGNILVYILIAIIALAALTMAVARSSRESVGTIDREKSDLGATEIFDFANAVRGSVQNMLVQGVRPDQLCFDSPAYGAATFQYAACATPANRVFDPSGGNAPAPRVASAGVLDTSRAGSPNYGVWYVPDSIRVQGVGSDCGTADCNELVLVIAPLTANVCISLNKKLGIATPDTIPVNGTLVSLTPYLGSFSYGSVIDASALTGKRTGCFQNTTGANMFYAVLKAN